MKALVLLASTLLLSMPALAAPPTKESVLRLLEATEAEKSVVTMQKQIDTQMRGAMGQAMKKLHADADSKQFTDIFGKKMEAMVGEEIGWKKMQVLYQIVYSENFTQEEIDGLITFYESPLGRTFVSKMPVVAQKSASLMQQKMGPLMQRLQRTMQETINEVQKKKGPAEARRAAPGDVGRRG